MRLLDAYPEMPALVFRGQTRYQRVWRYARKRLERWAILYARQGGVVASALGAVGLDYRDVGLDTWGSNSMPLTHITLANLCLACETTGLTIGELLHPSERGLTGEERGQLLNMLRRARSELLELDPHNKLVPEISRLVDNVEPHESPGLSPTEAPTPLLSEARLPAWMRQRI